MSLADCEGSAEMVYHWLRVQIVGGTELPRPEQKNPGHRRHHDNQEDEQRPRAMVNTHSHVFVLLMTAVLRNSLAQGISGIGLRQTERRSV